MSTMSTIKLNSLKLSGDRFKTLWTVIHEELHAAGATGFHYVFADKVEHKPHKDDKRLRFNGFHLLIDHEDGNVTDMYRQINEGAIELITERIFKGYLKQTGEVKDGSEFPVHISSKYGFGDESYARSRFNIMLYTAVVSAVAGVPRKTVEDAVIRAFLSNGEIVPESNLDANQAMLDMHPKLPEVLMEILNLEYSYEISPNLCQYEWGTLFTKLAPLKLSRDILKKSRMNL